MAIVTISREIAALGDETAHELSKQLGYRFVDKAALESRFESYGFSEKKLEKYDERKPSFWSSLSQERDDYLHFLKTAMLEEAMSGDCIIIGRGASFVFHELPGTVSVRLVAPMEQRIERVKSYFRCDEKRAQQIIDQSDRDRSGFNRYFFNADWGDASNYQMVINTGGIHPTTAAGLIKHLLSFILTPETEKQSKAKILDFALAQDVVTQILYRKNIPVHFLEASCSGDVVTLRGVVNSQAAVEAAVEAAKEVRNVKTVRTEIQVVQEYSVMP